MKLRFSPKKHWHYIATFFLVIGIAGAITYGHITHFFTIKKIFCHVGNNPCPDYLEAEWQKSMHKSIFLTDAAGEGQKILSYLPSFSKVETKKILPNTLEVSFDALPPVYQLQQNQNQFWTVDEAGMIIDGQASASGQLVIHAETANLPDLRIHQKLDTKLHQHLWAMATFLQQHPMDYQTIVLDNINELHIQLPDGKRAQLRVDDAEVAIQKLAYVLSSVDFTSFHQQIVIIDLRFKYPILRV